ncbi:MAG: hypothetical protein ACI4IV_00305 [Acutalibacteraceae bacterium]
MADTTNFSAQNGFSDAVCIDAGRVYDSCMDRDCLENLRVYFSDCDNAKIQSAVSCKIKCANVDDVHIDVEPVSFNRGFYSCDLTFYFTLYCDVVQSCSCVPDTIVGIAAFSKKVILCGSEGSVKTFSSRTVFCDEDVQNAPGTNLPKCVVECVDPVVLDSKICDLCCCENRCVFPYDVLRKIDGAVSETGPKALYVTLGLFSIVQLIRNVQMMVPVYDFCIPQKECREISNDSPCDVFSKIKFPTEEFFPKSSVCDDCGCDS